MPTPAQPQLDMAKLILPTEAFDALRQFARSRRISSTPSRILESILLGSGIYCAAWIPRDDYQSVKTLHMPTTIFSHLKVVQGKLNGSYNFTVMDIVTANLMLFGVLMTLRDGEMIGSVQGKGISPYLEGNGDLLEHYDLNSGNTDWQEL